MDGEKINRGTDCQWRMWATCSGAPVTGRGVVGCLDDAFNAPVTFIHPFFNNYYFLHGYIDEIVNL